MPEEKKFLYADENRQIERGNRLTLMTFGIYALCNFMIVFVAFLRGYRTLGFTLATAVISLGAIAIMAVIYTRNKQSAKMRWVSLWMLAFLSFMMTWAFDCYYMRFAAVAPVAVYILY